MERWTYEQLKAIESREDNILVSASAGTGKTSVMIERIISLLESGESLENIAVCTFTKASALDMRAKLFKRLTALSLDKIPFANAQLKMIKSMQMSTLHSFCQQIIKTYFYCIDIDPDFEIAAEETEVILKNVITDVIEKYLEKADEDFLILYDVLLKNRSSMKLEQLIKQLYTFAFSLEKPFEWLELCAECKTSDKENFEIIKNFYKEGAEKIKIKAEHLKEQMVGSGFLRDLEAMETFIGSINALEKCQTLKGGSSLKNLPRQFIDYHDTMMNYRKEYAKITTKLSVAESAAASVKPSKYAKILAAMTIETAINFRKEKNRKGITDYCDLEHFAAEILKNEEALNGISEKYKYVFVDEFQDISPIQDTILSRLSAKKFYVGDVKQSIYGFRMCNPKIFIDKLNAERNENSRKIELNVNFRSDEKILEFCNSVFDGLMTKKLGQVDYKNSARFIAGSGIKSGAEISAFAVKGKVEINTPAPGIYSVKNHDFIDRQLKLADAEQNLIVNHILELSEKQFDGEPVKYGDIAILLRERNSDYAKRLFEKLKLAEIPAVMNDKKSADECIEISIFINILKLINNHYDDIALAAAMRSFLGGFSDDDLAAVRSRYKHGFFFEAVERFAAEENTGENTGNELYQRIRKFAEKISHYTELSYFMQSSELAGKICADSEYFKYILSLKNGAVKAKELSSFLNIMEKSAYNSSLSEFLNSIENNMPQIEIPAETDAVKIMTIHSSKGLEFNFVILANLTKKFNEKDTKDTMLLDADSGLSIKYWDWENRISLPTSLYLVQQIKKQHKLIEEEMRLLYVALTRAKYGLSLFYSLKEEREIKEPEDCRSFYDFLQPELEKISTYYNTDDCEIEYKYSGRQIIYSEPEKKLVEKIKEYTGFVYPLSKTPVKATVTKLSGTDSLYEDNEKAFYIGGGENDDRALKKGTAYHRIMQEIDFFKDFSPEWKRLEKELPFETSEVNAGEIEQAVKKMTEKIGNKKYYKELPFITSLEIETDNINEKQNILVQGVIDLIVINENSALIIDYKSGEMRRENMKSYQKQLDIYSKAAENILRKKVENKYLYFFKSAEFI